MQDIMVDLETLGVRAGCAILSIGAVGFNEFGVEGEFYAAITRKSCEDAGLHVDGSTLAWWERQSEEARKVLTDPDAIPLLHALGRFRVWAVESYGQDVRVWGNGADFDLPILNAAHTALGVPPTWKPYNGRCYRTVKNQFKDIKLVRSGEHHNALADARSQAEHLVNICKQRDWKLA